MECLAHHARKCSSSSDVSSIEGARACISVDPAQYQRSTPSPTDVAAMLRRKSPDGKTPHVCVVGAGLAGLRAAKVLGDYDIKVTLLEARDRVGGRVRP